MTATGARSELWPAVVLAASLLGCGAEPEVACTPAQDRICTLIGTGDAGLAHEGLPPLETELYLPQDVTAAEDGALYVLDWNNHRVRVLANGAVHTLIGTGSLGDAPDGPALETSLNHPTHIAVEADGDLIVSAWHNSKVLRYDTKKRSVRSICGTGARSFNGDGKNGLETLLDLPVATVILKDGSILISDQANQRIRRLAPDGIVTTVVGVGTAGYSGDGGPAELAEINLPVSQSAAPAGRIAAGADGALYLADTVNHVVRKVDAEGIITTLAGTGTAGNGTSSDPGKAKLDTPTDIAADDEGNVYIADTMNSCVRRVTSDDKLETVVGRCGERGYSGDDGPPDEALLDRPYGVEVGPDGLLYVADTHNHVIRVVVP